MSNETRVPRENHLLKASHWDFYHKPALLLPVVEIQYDDAYVLIDAIKITSSRIEKSRLCDFLWLKYNMMTHMYL